MKPQTYFDMWDYCIKYVGDSKRETFAKQNPVQVPVMKFTVPDDLIIEKNKIKESMNKHYFWFVNPNQHTVTLHDGLDRSKNGQGFWYAFGKLPEEYESWIDNSDRIF